MRIALALGWLLIPVAFGAYHYGPGQEKLKLDDAAVVLEEADRCAADENWSAAADAYDEAIAKLPADRAEEARRIRLERDKAWMNCRKLPEANADLKGLVDDIQGDPKADPKLLSGAREAYASAQYYLTWLMKLEGLGETDWEPEIESARQAYRLLAEEAEKNGDEPAATRHREDLESAIRLARMDPGDLQGRSIPKQCQGCKSGSCKKPGNRPGQKPSAPKDSRSAGSGPPPDGSGS